MACDCIRRLNEQAQVSNNPRLANTILRTRTGINFSTGKSIDYVELGVKKRDRKGPNLAWIIPTFCPFCGKKYKED